MKKLIILCLLTVGIIEANTSFAQDKKEDKAIKKETKMNKKDSKGKEAKATKKEVKENKKESKTK